jgi:hypothetical protein
MYETVWVRAQCHDPPDRSARGISGARNLLAKIPCCAQFFSMVIPLRKLVLAVISLVIATCQFALGAKIETASPPPAPDGTRMIADFRHNLPGVASSGSWGGKIGLSPNGFVIQGSKGADGKGEISEKITPVIDLSKDAYVEVALGVGAKNEVPEITVGFTDAAGVQYTARIRIDQMLPQLPVWFRVKLTDFKLNNWQGNMTGKTIDWTRIERWHLQGDWASTSPFHVMFIALRTRQ